MIRVIALCLLLSASACAGSNLPVVHSEPLPDGRHVLGITGRISAGAVAQAVRAMEAERPAMVYMISLGGDAWAGIALGDYLRSQNIPVYVPAGYKCASACAMAFLMARDKSVGADARIGIHLPVADRRVGVFPDPEMLWSWGKEAGIPETIIAEAIDRGPEHVRWLWPDEMAELGIH